MSDIVKRLIDEGALYDAACALEKNPDISLMLRLAAALLDANRADNALRWYHRILEIEPANAEALLCLAMLREDDSVEEGRAFMDRYVQTRPQDAAGRLRRALMLPAIAESSEHIERIIQRLDEELHDILDARFAPVREPAFEVGATPFFLAYYGRNPRPLIAKVARACRSVYPTETSCRRKLFAHSKRLRIGFISTYFHEHSVTKALHGFFADLPRESFEVLVFAIAPRADRWNAIVRSSAERYIELPLDPTRVREAITEARLDIAFFMDIGMDPLTYFLAYWRLAPLQVATWGHSVTSGIDTVDYYVSHDPVEIANAQEHYSEKLVRLPGYFMPRYLKPTRPARPPRARKRLYHCPHNLFKLHPDFDAALKAILERDPEAEIVLVDSGRPWTGQLRNRLRRTLGALESRVRVAPRMTHPEFLRHLMSADVVLDTFYFGGCNLSCDAFALELPIVTLPGLLLPGRFTAGLYEKMGIQGCVARTPEDYVDIALRVGRERGYREAIVEQVKERNEQLFNRPDCGRALGAVLLEIAERSR